MSEAFDILSAALKEAIADVQNPQLPRRTLETPKPKVVKRFKRNCALRRTRKLVAR